MKIVLIKGSIKNYLRQLQWQLQRFPKSQRIPASPCRMTMLAIWMTGSLSGSGNIPFRFVHSISKDKIRKGATLTQSPSGACEIILFTDTSTSICARDTGGRPKAQQNVLKCRCETYRQGANLNFLHVDCMFRR